MAASDGSFRIQFLVNDVGLELRAAYGSSKDISVYSSVGLKAENIYIVGKISRKQHGSAHSLSEGDTLRVSLTQNDK